LEQRPSNLKQERSVKARGKEHDDRWEGKEVFLLAKKKGEAKETSALKERWEQELLRSSGPETGQKTVDP